MQYDDQSFCCGSQRGVAVAIARHLLCASERAGSFYVWSAVFIAFAVHLHVHVVQAVVVTGYVPGLLTTLLLLPYCYLGLQTIWLRTSGWEMLGLGIAGTLFIALNLRFAHWLGKHV